MLKTLIFWTKLTALILLICLSCGKKEERLGASKAGNTHLENDPTDAIHMSTLIPATGKVIEREKVAPPKMQYLNENPNRVNVHANINRGNKAKEVIIDGFDTSIEIGKDGIPLPETIPVKGRKVLVKEPQPVEAGAARMKDLAITDIRCIDIDQGMKSALVITVLEDQRGYLWIGTDGGGLSKYDGNHFTHYTTEEGMSSNRVNALLEDGNGNIWIASGGGFSRYDGKTFTHFSTDEGLNSNWVKHIVEDKSGTIWMTSSDGLIRFEPTKDDDIDGYLTIYTTQQGLAYKSNDAVIQDSLGNIWFGTFNHGVHRFTPNKHNAGGILVQLSTQSGLSGNKVRSLLADSMGRIWIGTFSNGVNIFESGNEQKQHRLLQFSSDNGLSHRSVVSLFEDSQHNIWVGTGSGTNKATFHSRDSVSFSFYSVEQGLSHTKVHIMYEDRQGNLWWGTQNGLCIHDPFLNEIGGGSHFNYYSKREGLLSDKVVSVLEDQRGDLWFGTMGGLHRYDGQTIEQYNTPDGLSSRSVRTMIEDSRGHLWFGTERGGLNRYIPDGKRQVFQYGIEQGLSDIHITAMLEDSKGNYWFATLEDGVNHFKPDATGMGGTFTQYTAEAGLSDDEVRYILEDHQENIWFGTLGGGLSCYMPDSNNQDGQFQHFTTKEGLSHDKVNAILEDRKGILWFGTWGGGITMYDPKSKLIKYITTKEGLSSNIIWTMIEDEEGRVWVATENGLSLCVPQPSSTNTTSSPFGEFDILTYGKADGLKTIVFEGNSVDLTSNNEIWWGGGYNGGLTSLDLDHFKLPERIPTVSLNTIEINQQLIDYRNLANTDPSVVPFIEILKNSVGEAHDFSNYPEKLDLPYQLNHLTFHFSAIDWQAPHKLTYSYRLKETNDKWSLANSSAFADYRNLDYGSYTFQVKAMGVSQIWSEPFNYSFTIRPPWWHTWWARLIYVAMGISLLYGFIQLQLAKLRKERNDKVAFAEALIFAQEAERKRIARDLHDGVGQSLLLIKKQLDVTHKVSRENQQLISDTLEEVRSISRDLHPFQLEKFGLTAAIEEVVTKVEKSTDLFISQEIENIDSLLTDKGEINLFRTIQEAFNNIIKHAEATAAKITINRAEQEILVVIQDNGKGFDHELAIVKSKSLGLRTMFERIAAIGGELRIEKGGKKGTMISIHIPIKI